MSDSTFKGNDCPCSSGFPSPSPTDGTVPCGSHLGRYRRRDGAESFVAPSF